VFTRPLLYHNQLLQLRLLLLLPVALVVANKVAFSVINTGILRRYLYRSRNLPYLEVTILTGYASFLTAKTTWYTLE
jgi:hypothetical protein